MIIKNGKTISSVYKGSQVIDKIYKGTLVVYESFKNLIASGVPPLTLMKCKGIDLINYKIEGNSIQNGTPTLEAPIEIESVGERTKNLFDEQWEKGSINISNGENIANGADIRTKNYIILKPNTTYYITIPSKNIYPILYKKDKSFSKYAGLKMGSFRYTTTDEEYYLRIMIYENTEVPLNVQVEEGNIATEYEPYGYKIPVKVSNENEEITTNIYLNEPLRKIGDYADYIDFKNKKVIRRIKELILVGTESFVNRTSSSGLTEHAFFQYTNKDKFISAIGLSNWFDRLDNTLGAYNHIRFINDTVYLGIVVENKFASTSDELREKLKVNNLKIYYQIEEIPETIELPNIPTFKGTTIIEVDTNVQPSNMEVTYKGKRVN